MPILTSEERIGTLLAEKYRLDRIIGKGGMGVIFGAEHTWTGRQVAVKIIHPTLAEDKSLVERLLRESMICRIAPISPQLILSYIAEKVLDLPKSY